MKYYIIAGEASGDLHASNLMKEMKLLDSSADFRCWGGDLMEEQGGLLVKHYRDLAFMGFAEVIANLRTVLNNIKFCKKDMHGVDWAFYKIKPPYEFLFYYTVVIIAKCIP